MLPSAGRIACSRCFASEATFNRSVEERDGWRITNNPLAWGSREPKVIVLGFSKGPNQIQKLLYSHHNDIAYAGSRKNVGKILAGVGLLSEAPDNSSVISHLIAEREGPYHFGSLVRCTVERREGDVWKGSGGGMLDKFVATPFGDRITKNCCDEFLKEVKAPLVVMFGLGTGLNYVRSCKKLFEAVLGGSWRSINEVAYTNGAINVVHVEHFASQGSLIPEWLGERGTDRHRYCTQARTAVKTALSEADLASLRDYASRFA